MRCLLTGMSRAQAEGKVSLGVWAFGPQIKEALELDGWYVEQREPLLTDDASQWDVVLVGLVPMLGFSGPFQYAALRLLSQAIRFGNAATFIDDWQLRGITSHLRTCAKMPKYLCQADRADRGRKNYEWACENRDKLAKTVDWLLTHPWPRPLWPRMAMVPVVDGLPHAGLWGKNDDTHIFDEATWVDPTWTVDVNGYEPLPHTLRTPAWIKASLTKSGEGWLARTEARATWPILRAGKREWELGKVPERELTHDLYTTHTGVISTPYNHAGSGWFRVRFVQAAMANAVVLCDPREMPHPAYGRTVEEYEVMRTYELECAADDQLVAIAQGSWSLDRFRETVVAALR